jgi:hypothetical protein
MNQLGAWQMLKVLDVVLAKHLAPSPWMGMIAVTQTHALTI